MSKIVIALGGNALQVDNEASASAQEKVAKSTIQKIQTTLMKPEVKKAGTEQIKKKAKSSIIEQLSRKKKEMAEREVSRTIPAKSKKQDMEL